MPKPHTPPRLRARTHTHTFGVARDSAIGYAEGIAPRTEVNYIPEKTSFLVNSLFSAGAINIDDEGIVKITARES